MGRAGWLLAAACLCYLSWRLFCPPLIGIANNGDFPKITGPLGLAPASGWPADRFLYVTRDYKRAPEYVWKSRYYSSEAVLARIADTLARIFEGGNRFDIRWMGAMHLAFILLAYTWLLAALRPLGAPVQIAAGTAAGLIFGDAAYLAYCNSFFTDAAALSGLVLTVAGLIDLAVRGSSRARLAGIVCGGLVLAASKTQHALLALPLALLIWLVARHRDALALAAGGAIVAGASLLMVFSPAFYRSEPLFSLIFYKLMPHAADAERDLAALGLDRSNLAYVGMHAYSPGAPTGSFDFEQDFVRHVTPGRLLRFYVSQPKRAAAILWRDLQDNASGVQPGVYGNYTADSGRPPRQLAPGYWSRVEGDWLTRMPWLLPVWLAAVALVSAAVRSRLAYICLGVVAMACMEFAIATLADANETSRHLMLFHALVEITICFAMGAAAYVIQAARQSRPAAPASQRA